MIQDLKVKDIQPGENYRRTMDKGGMKELTASVKQFGVLQPIIVRKQKKGYEVVCGHRRHAAALAAGHKTIPARILNVDDAMALEIAVIENTQREDPNPMDEALGFKKLLDLGKHDVASLSAKLDKSPAYVYGRLRLNDLDKSCQKALLSGDIDLGHALALLRISDKKDQREMLEGILEQDMSPAQVRDAVRSDYGRDFRSAVFDTEACGKCDHLSSTQGKLFGDVREEGDDRCMNEKCFMAKTTLALETRAKEYFAKGWSITTGDRETINKLMAKGHGVSDPFKPKCKTCHERIYFWSVAEGHIRSGWWCPSNRCYNETVLGMAPKEKKTPAGESRTDAGEEPVSRGGSERAGDVTGAETRGRGVGESEKTVAVYEKNPDGSLWLVCPCCAEKLDLVEAAQ